MVGKPKSVSLYIVAKEEEGACKSTVARHAVDSRSRRNTRGYDSLRRLEEWSYSGHSYILD